MALCISPKLLLWHSSKIITTLCWNIGWFLFFWTKMESFWMVVMMIW